MSRLFLVDFDGTITKKDTLDHIARKFFPNDYKEWGRKIMNGEFSIFEWLKAFEERFDIRQEEYDNVLDEIEIDRSFIEFAKKNKVVIVSGGFIYNIKKILSRFIDPAEIEIYGNDLMFHSETKAKIIMNYSNENCGKCGVCKESVLDKYRKEFEEIIFIGDGITDACVSEQCDQIYAKRGLYLDKYLSERNIIHNVFDEFSEIEVP